ncbi:MAG: DUF4142 domain-containing protein [Alphaproteobacteria bacterium]
MTRTFVFTAMGAVLLSTTAMAQVSGATSPQAGSSYTMGAQPGSIPPLDAPARGLPVTDTPQAGKVVVLGEGIGARRLAEERRMEQQMTTGIAGSTAGTGAAMTGSSIAGGNMADQDRAARMAPVASAADFVNRAAQSDLYEIASSRMAVDRATTEPVRQFARHMIMDHTATSELVKTQARASGLEPPAQPDLDQQQKLSQLQGLRGVAFDRMYVNQQVLAHREAVDLYGTVARSTDPDLQPYRSLAQQTLPKLQQHLNQIEGIAASAPLASVR